MSEQRSNNRRSSLLSLGAPALKRILVLFWALYFSFVVASNLGDGIKELGLVSENWVFASGNYGMIAQVVSIYAIPGSVAAALFGLVILWEIFIAALFWRLFRNPAELDAPGRQLVVRAFGAALVLWMAFILSDELFIAYHKVAGLEGAHVAMLGAQAITLLVVWLVKSRE